MRREDIWELTGVDMGVAEVVDVMTFGTLGFVHRVHLASMVWLARC